MVCEHCGAACDDDALICFECGAPIGDDPAQSGLHKLPAHLQAPITVQLPAVSPAAVAAAAPDATLPAHDMAVPLSACPRCGAPCEPNASICFECGAPLGVGSPRTGPLSIPDYLKAPITIELPVIVTTTRPRAATPTRRLARVPTRREAIIAGGILAAALVAVLVGTVIVQYRIAPPPVPLRAIYHDPQHRFSFARPALWDAAALGDGVRLTDAGGTSILQITADPALNLDAAAYADLLAQPYGIATVPPMQIGGANWEQRAGRTRGSDGVLREHIVLAVIYNRTLYAIQFSCPDSIFADVDVQVYQPVLRSFTFDTLAARTK